MMTLEDQIKERLNFEYEVVKVVGRFEPLYIIMDKKNKEYTISMKIVLKDNSFIYMKLYGSGDDVEKCIEFAMMLALRAGTALRFIREYFSAMVECAVQYDDINLAKRTQFQNQAIKYVMDMRQQFDKEYIANEKV